MLRGRTYETGKAVRMYESKKVKRYRSAFTTSQINYLEKQFEKCPYIGSATRKEVANLLRIPERAIKIWFQNRRMKEKKEVNNKEYNVESDNVSINMEFTKDALINAHSSQSANDRQCSLHVAKHVGTTNFTPHQDKSTILNESKINDLKNVTIGNRKPYKFKGGEMTNNIKQEAERPMLSERANLIKYNLTNSYNPNFFNYLELNKNNVPKNKIMPETSLKTESFRDAMLHIPPNFPQYQDLPEDLSPRNLSNVIMPQTHQGNIHLSPAYIPLCNTQDVCLSTGNVIWKPVNVIPAMPSNTIPVTVPKKQQSINRNNEQKCKCDCNCHFRNELNYEQRNLEPAPQYVIAVPYGNNVILR